MQLIHAARALRAVTTREIIKFVQQRGRLLSALVRPLMSAWRCSRPASRMYSASRSSRLTRPTSPTKSISCRACSGSSLLFHGMQSSLSMVYDPARWGMMRLLLDRAAAALGAAGVQARGPGTVLLGDHLLCVPRGLHPVRRDLRLERLAHGAAGAGAVRAHARIAVAVSLGAHQAGREFRPAP